MNNLRFGFQLIVPLCMSTLAWIFALISKFQTSTCRNLDSRVSQRTLITSCVLRLALFFHNLGIFEFIKSWNSCYQLNFEFVAEIDEPISVFNSVCWTWDNFWTWILLIWSNTKINFVQIEFSPTLILNAQELLFNWWSLVTINYNDLSPRSKSNR